MAYASIDPRMWDDEKFVLLDDLARLLWIYLITGPEAMNGPPGLIIIGTGGLAEALRRSTQDIHEALGRLRAVGMVEIDPTHRLIRVPRAPFYRAPGNANVVRGWYRRWTSLPNSQLKYDHLETLRAALAECDVADSTRAVFEDTFGRDLERRVAFRGKQTTAVVVHSGGLSAQGSLALEPSLSTGSGLSVDEEVNQQPVGEVARASGSAGESFENHSRMVPEWPIPERIPDPLRGSDQSGSRARTRDPAPPAPEPDPVARLALEVRRMRLERVYALRESGIGATLPPPSLHDQVARGEPERLVRAWFKSAVEDGVNPEELVRQRASHLFDALEAQAREEGIVACLRETVCYSPSVVDWALSTEIVGGKPQRRGARRSGIGLDDLLSEIAKAEREEAAAAAAGRAMA